MNIIDFAKILSAAFAGISIIIAIFVFHANSERAFFSDVRKCLVRFRVLISIASETFDEAGLVEIGCCISNELNSVCPKEFNNEQLQEFFYNQENANFIRQAIFLGIGKSKTISRAKDVSNELTKLSSEINEPLPLTRISLGILSAYFQSIVHTVSSGGLIDDIFASVRSGANVRTDDGGINAVPRDLIFRQMSIFITLLHLDFINNYAIHMLKHMDRVAGIITSSYESKSDRQLRSISKREKDQVPHHLHQGNAVAKSEKALFEYLKFYKEALKPEEWDRLVEYKTMLESITSGSERKRQS